MSGLNDLIDPAKETGRIDERERCAQIAEAMAACGDYSVDPDTARAVALIIRHAPARPRVIAAERKAEGENQAARGNKGEPGEGV